jgi:hypothetical protein
MFYAGVILILLLNALMYYDQMQHNKDLLKDKKLAFNITAIMFILIELLFFLCVYVLIIKTIGFFND